MKTYAFEFTTRIDFDLPIVNQNFILRCMPKNNMVQRIYDEQLVIQPTAQYSIGKDSFGNKIVSGYIADEHNSFSFSVSGKASLSKYKIMDDLDRIYLYPSPRTTPSKEIEDFFDTLELTDDKREAVSTISSAVNNYITYKKDVTDTNTTAAQAFDLKAGVCQDFAHITITLLHLAKIPARYAAGFIQGDGETHAWVEYYLDGAWYGIDPTNNNMIDYGYIKLSHGRDSNDCSVERGCFASKQGIVTQSPHITVKVGEI